MNVWFIFFQSEVTKLQEQIDTEVRVRKDFDEKVAKMNQLLTTGQEVLQQEKKTVEMLRQQIVSQTQTKMNSKTYFCLGLRHNFLSLHFESFLLKCY